MLTRDTHEPKQTKRAQQQQQKQVRRATACNGSVLRPHVIERPIVGVRVFEEANVVQVNAVVRRFARLLHVHAVGLRVRAAGPAVAHSEALEVEARNRVVHQRIGETRDVDSSI
jgi:hypothetical protein